MTPPAYHDPSRAELVAVDVLGLVLDWTLYSIMSAYPELPLEHDDGRGEPALYLAETLTYQLTHLQRSLAAYRELVCQPSGRDDHVPF